MSQLVQQRNRLDVIGIGIIALTLATAGAHLYLGGQPDEDLRLWFLLNGLGYLALLAAFFLPQFVQIRATVRWVLLGYTLLTIILWFFLGGISRGEIDRFDITVKVVEAALVVLLLIDARRDSTREIGN